MKSYLINLQRSPQRLSWMSDQFSQLGIEFERVEAIDGRQQTSSELQRHASPRLDGMEWTASEIACFLSHRKCWQIIASGEAPYAAVFEDDLHLDDEVAALLSGHYWIPMEAEIIKMEAPDENRYQGSASNFGRRHRLFRSGDPWNASGAYIVSKRLAERLARVEAINCPVDQFLFDNKLKNRFFDAHEIRPGICIQASETKGYTGPLASVIGEERVLPAVSRQRTRRGIAARILRELARPWKRAYRRIAARYREMRAPLIIFPAQRPDRSGSV